MVNHDLFGKVDINATVQKPLPKLVFEEPAWFVKTCRIFNEKGEYIGSFVDKELGKKIVALINKKNEKET